MKKNLFLILLCFLSALCLWFAQIRREQLNLAGRIAPQILRFHVIANSNSSKDQEIKLNVKSYLLEHIYQEFAKSFPKKTLNPSFAHIKKTWKATQKIISARWVSPILFPWKLPGANFRKKRMETSAFLPELMKQPS